MSGLILAGAAVVAGAVSISSPCCLPLIPSYLSFISSQPGGPTGQVTRTLRRRDTLLPALGFVAGFTIVFTTLGATASVAGTVLLRHLPALTRVAGGFIVVMGLATLGVLRIPFMQHEFRLDLSQLRRGPGGAIPLGMAFALGWTPCIGPVLASILTLAGGASSLLSGVVLLGLYSLGLGLPFVGLALGYRSLSAAQAFLVRHGRAVERTGGLLLILVGVGYLTGTWAPLFRPIQRWFARFGWPPI